VASAAVDGVVLRSGRRELVGRGGTREGRGNTSETGEWNACVDPGAAETLLAKGSLSRIFPLDATQDVLFTLDDLEALPSTPLAAVVRDAVRYYVAFHREADNIDGCYLHDPVTLIGSLLRPELVIDAIGERLACDTGSDPHLAGSLYRATDERPTVNVATAIDPEGMRQELIERLARAVNRPAARAAAQH